MDQLDPGRPLVSMDRDRTPEVEVPREGRTPGGRATVDQGNADRARRAVLSTVVAVCSLAAKHNRAHRSAKLAGSLGVAQHRPLEGLALEGHTKDEAHHCGVYLGDTGSQERDRRGENPSETDIWYCCSCGGNVVRNLIQPSLW